MILGVISWVGIDLLRFGWMVWVLVDGYGVGLYSSTEVTGIARDRVNPLFSSPVFSIIPVL